tara:strand:+ start:4349 stop:14581 length:10233 start_codon:yes stop_codon:yes gene_type:complete
MTGGYRNPQALLQGARPKQQPGTIDKVFNTTFGIVQQPLWRMWRAAKEEDIDLWSKQGLLDPALLPILGMAFDNKNTVMPDELFGDHLGAQIGMSILTDPLAFATSGLTGLARTAKATGKAFSGVKNTEHFHRAAHYGAGRLDDVAKPKLGLDAEKLIHDKTAVSDLVKGIDHAKQNGGFLDEAGNVLGKKLSFQELDDLDVLQKRLLKLGDTKTDKELLSGSLNNLMKNGRKREMGLTLPLLDLFIPGAYIKPPAFLAKHDGWMNWYGNVLKRTYGTPLKLGYRLIDPVLNNIAGLRVANEKTKSVVKNFGQGLKDGALPRAVARYMVDGAKPFMNSVDKAKVHGTTADRIYNQAYILNEQGNKVHITQSQRQMSEHVDIVAEQIKREAKEKNLTFRQAVQRRFGEDGASEFFFASSKASAAEEINAFKSQLSTFLTRKELGTLDTNVGQLDFETLRVDSKVANSKSYHLGKQLRTMYTKMFKNDLGVQGAEDLKTFARRQEAMTSQAIEAMAHRLYALRDELAEQGSYTEEAIDQIMYSKLSLTTGPEEMADFFSNLDSGEMTLAQFSNELNEFLGGRVAGTVELLKTTAAENLLSGAKGMQDMLDALSVPILDIDASLVKKVAAENKEDALKLNHLRAGGQLDSVETIRLVEKYQLDSTKTLFTRMTGGSLDLGVEINRWEELGGADKVGGEEVVTLGLNAGDPQFMTFGSRTKMKTSDGGSTPLLKRNETTGNLEGVHIASLPRQVLFGQKKTNTEAASPGIIHTLREAHDVLSKFIESGGKAKDFKGKFKYLLGDNPTQADLHEALHAVKADGLALKKLQGIMKAEEDFTLIKPDMTDSSRFRPTYTKAVNIIGETKDGKAVRLDDISSAFGDEIKDVKNLGAVVTRLRTRQAALDQYVRLNGTQLNNMPKSIPDTFKEGFQEDMLLMQDLLTKALVKPLSKDKNGNTIDTAERLFNALDSQRTWTRMQAVKHNLLPKGATPLGYLARVASGEELGVVETALNDVIDLVPELKNEIAPAIAKARMSRSMTVHQLNEVLAVTKRASDVHPSLADDVKKLEAVREAITGTPDYKRFSTDPTASIIAHHSQVQEAINRGDWFRYIEKHGAEHGAVAGRIIDVVEGGSERGILATGVRGTKSTLSTKGEGIPELMRTPKEHWAEMTSASEVLKGVRATNNNKVDFQVLMPEDYWVVDGRNALEGSDHARTLLEKLYTNNVLNESGVLMLREAFRNNPKLINSLSGSESEEAIQAFSNMLKQKPTTAIGRAILKRGVGDAQTEQANAFLSTIATSALRETDTFKDLSLSKTLIVNKLGTQGYLDWATKGFKVDKETARRSLSSDEDFAAMIGASVLTKQGTKNLKEMGLGKWARDFTERIKRILSQVIKGFTGGSQQHLDEKLHKNLVKQLEGVVGGALQIAPDIQLSNRAHRNLTRFMRNEIRNSVEPIIEQNLKNEGLLDGYDAYAKHWADTRQRLVESGVDLQKVAADLEHGGLAILKNYLSKPNTRPRLTVDDALSLNGLDEITPWRVNIADDLDDSEDFFKHKEDVNSSMGTGAKTDQEDVKKLEGALQELGFTADDYGTIDTEMLEELMMTNKEFERMDLIKAFKNLLEPQPSLTGERNLYDFLKARNLSPEILTRHGLLNRKGQFPAWLREGILPKHPTTINSPNRLRDAERIAKQHPGLSEIGKAVNLKTTDGKAIATKYNRVVYGDHGPYIEIDPKDLNPAVIKKRYKSKNKWYDQAFVGGNKAKGIPGAKIYFQKKGVGGLSAPPGKHKTPKDKPHYGVDMKRGPEGYADYKPGMVYVSPDDIAKVRGRSKGVDPAIASLVGLRTSGLLRRGDKITNPFDLIDARIATYDDEIASLHKNFGKYGEVYPEGELATKLGVTPKVGRGTLKPKQEPVGTFEVSTAGDKLGKQFSAFNAKFADGKTIEEAYQLDVKGYRSLGWDLKKAKADKGKNAPNQMSPKELEQAYDDLWSKWAQENPGKIEELADATFGMRLTDKFAGKGNVNQAKSLQKLVDRVNKQRDPFDTPGKQEPWFAQHGRGMRWVEKEKPAMVGDSGEMGSAPGFAVDYPGTPGVPTQKALQAQHSLGKLYDETVGTKGNLGVDEFPEFTGQINPGLNVKIISGGQIGADQLGLSWARSRGIPTGGTAAQRFTTKADTDQAAELAELGLTEVRGLSQKGKGVGYKQRTVQNVKDSDVTLIFADRMSSAGTKQTIEAAKEHKKPVLKNPSPTELKNFLRENPNAVLNIAGNANLSQAKKQVMYETLEGAMTTSRVQEPTIAQLTSESMKVQGLPAQGEWKYQAAPGWNQLFNIKEGDVGIKGGTLDDSFVRNWEARVGDMEQGIPAFGPGDSGLRRALSTVELTDGPEIVVGTTKERLASINEQLDAAGIPKEFRPELLARAKKTLGKLAKEEKRVNKFFNQVQRLQAKKARFVKQLEPRLEAMRRTYRKSLNEEFRQSNVHQLEEQMGVLDSMVQDLTRNPQLRHRAVALDFLAASKLSKRDLDRLQDTFASEDVVNAEMRLTGKELTELQRKLYNHIGEDKNRTYDRINEVFNNVSKAEKLMSDLSNKALNVKELKFIDNLIHSEPARALANNGQLSAVLRIPEKGKWATSHTEEIARLKDLKEKLVTEHSRQSGRELEDVMSLRDRYEPLGDNRPYGAFRKDSAEYTAIGDSEDIIFETRRELEALRDRATAGAERLKEARAVDKPAMSRAAYKEKVANLKQKALEDQVRMMVRHPDSAATENLQANRLEGIYNSKVSGDKFDYRHHAIPDKTSSSSMKAQAAAETDKYHKRKALQLHTKEEDLAGDMTNAPYTIRIETREGIVEVPSDRLTALEYTLQSIGQGRNMDEAIKEGSRHGRPRELLGEQASAMNVKRMMGHQITLAPRQMNKAIHQQLRQGTPAKFASALKWYDAVHTTLKYLATSLRLPLDFHTANTISAMPQALMEDIGPAAMIRGFLDTGKIFAENVDDMAKLDKASAVMQSSALNPNVRKTPFSRLFSLHDKVEAGRYNAANPTGLEQGTMIRAGGQVYDYNDVIKAMLEEGALDTMIRADFVNIRDADSAVKAIRDMYKRTPGQGMRKGWQDVKKGAELSELFVRFSAMHGALHSGMDLRSAAQATARAMVDYSDLTQFEKVAAKRMAFFYTFPRKMIPKSLEFMFNNPGKSGSLLNAVIKDKEHVKTSEGRLEVAIGDKRVNVGRLAPQADAMVALASVADIFMPALGNLITTEEGLLAGDPRMRRFTGEASPDRPIGPSPILNVAGWKELLPTEDPLSGSTDWLEEMSRVSWALKVLAGDPILGSKDPEVEYSKLELAARTVVPYRKVRPGQEEEQMSRRIQAHKMRYERQLEQATADGEVTTAKFLREDIELMDRRLEELKRDISRAKGKAQRKQADSEYIRRPR